MASYTESRHLGFSGSVLWELGMHGQYIGETRHRLTTSVTTRPDGRGRTDAQLHHASLIMVTGDPAKPSPSAPRPWTGQVPCAPAASSTNSVTSPRSPPHHPRRRLMGATGVE